VAVNLALFCFYPIEKEYLLPAWPPLVVGLGLVLQRRRELVVVLSIVCLSNFVQVDFFAQTADGDAQPALSINEGYLIHAIRGRVLFRDVSTVQQWVMRMDELGGDDDYR
jgi:hypothetical protein